MAFNSCESQLIITVNNISKSLDSGIPTDIIFLDLSKAFDKVSIIVYATNYLIMALEWNY